VGKNGQESKCSGYYITPTGDVVCKDTGEVVYEGQFVESGEWNVYRDSEKGINRERVGGPLTFLRHDLVPSDIVLAEGRARKIPSLSTVREQVIRSRSRKKIRRYSRDERIKISIITEARSIAERLNIPKIAEETMGMILNMALKKEIPRTERDKKALLLAALWKAITFHKLPISRKDLMDEVKGDSKLLWTGLKKLSELGVLDDIKKIRVDNYGPHRDLLDRVKLFIESAATELGLPHTIAIEASRLIDILVNDYGKSLHGRQPEAVAGAVLYLVSHLYNYKIPQKKIAEVLGVVESSIRKQYKYLLEDMVFIVEV
jgi:transcription initiation factor TFIIB